MCKLGLITSYDSWVLREGCPIETLIKTNPIQLQILWIDTLPNQLLGFFINLYQLCGRDLILFILILARNLRSLLSSTQIWLVTQKLVPYGASWTCEDHCCLNYVCGHQDNSYSNTGFPAFMVVYPCLSLWWPVSLRKAVLLPYWDHSEHWTCAHSAAVGQNKTRNISSLLQNSDLKKTMMSFNWKAGFRFLREKEMMKSIDRLRISGIVQCLLKPHNSIG